MVECAISKKSHKNGLVKHILSKEPGSSQKIPETYFKKIKNKKFYPQLKAGDCIFHHCEVIHGSKKNTSNLDRIGLVISYKGLSAKIDKKTFKLQKLSLKNLLSLKKNNLKFISVIPARSGSKGIKNKNIFPLKGIPLVSYTLKEVTKSNSQKNFYFNRLI